VDAKFYFTFILSMSSSYTSTLDIARSVPPRRFYLTCVMMPERNLNLNSTCRMDVRGQVLDHKVRCLPIVLSLCEILFVRIMTCLCATCDMTHKCATRVFDVLNMIHSCVRKKIYGAGYKYPACPLFSVQQESFTYGTWLIHVYGKDLECGV